MLAVKLSPPRDDRSRGPVRALVVALAVGLMCLQDGAIGAEQPRDFDPFESATVRQAFQPDTLSADGPANLTQTGENQEGQAEKPGIPDKFDPFVTTAAARSERRLLETESTAEFDPFDAPIATPNDVQPAARFQEQPPGPMLDEPLPAPDEADPYPESQLDVNCNWNATPLHELTINIQLPAGRLPRNCSAEQPPPEFVCCDPCGPTRGWPMVGYQWKASGFCHNPLYFEEINLERYGYGCCGCLQYGVSAAHFFGTLPALPYLMAADCPWECDYTLGHYRPGSCPPWRFHWPTCCSGRGTFSEIGVVTGLIFLIP